MSKQPRSIDQFLRDKRKVNCPVCKIPQAIRDQIVMARRRGKISVPNILEWLKSEYGIALTAEQLRLHYGGMHDGEAGMVNR